MPFSLQLLYKSPQGFYETCQTILKSIRKWKWGLMAQCILKRRTVSRDFSCRIRKHTCSIGRRGTLPEACVNFTYGSWFKTLVFTSRPWALSCLTNTGKHVLWSASNFKSLCPVSPKIEAFFFSFFSFAIILTCSAPSFISSLASQSSPSSTCCRRFVQFFPRCQLLEF